MKKDFKKINLIELTSQYTGKAKNNPYKFVGTQKEAEIFCKKHYCHYSSVILNGVELIEQKPKKEIELLTIIKTKQCEPKQSKKFGTKSMKKKETRKKKISN